MSASRWRASLISVAFALAGACQFAASFDVRSVPIAGPDMYALLAQADADPQPELVLVSGRALTVVFDPDSDETATCIFEPGTTVFDISDTDGDGIAELYSVAGDRIYRRLLEPGLRDLESTLLFTRKTWLARADGHPKPYVLVTTWEDRPALALPDSEGLDLVGLDGSELTRFPTLPPPARDGRWTAGRVAPVQAGPPSALEFRFSATFEAEVDLGERPDDLTVAPTFRRATPIQAREASALAPEEWPWFSLAPLKSPDDRVSYALADQARGETFIRFRRAETRDVPDKGHPFYFTPRRRYPGTLVIPPSVPPDFNGDGFADLVMWSSPRPGISTDSLLRAAQSREWPVRLTMHTYSQLRDIYPGRSTTSIELRLPLAWSLLPEAGMPIRHLVLNDLNGDGLTDLGVATGRRRYAVWLSRIPGEFSREPDYTTELPEDIEEIALVTSAETDRSSIIVLRGHRAAYLLTLPR